MGRYQSGQLGLTVNQMASAFGGSNPSLPKRLVRGEKSLPPGRQGFLPKNNTR